MFIKKNIFFVLPSFCLFLAMAAAYNPHIFTNKFNMNVMNLMARSNNPQQAAECFKKYNPIIDEISKTFEREYNECCEIADDERNEIDERTLISRQKLANTTVETCEALYQCEKKEKVGNQYQCYVNEGNENSKVLRSVSNEASSYWADYLEEIHVTEYKEETCKNKTSETFERNSFEAYADLGNCLRGNTVTSSTTAKVTTSTTSSKTSTTTSSSNENTTEDDD